MPIYSLIALFVVITTTAHEETQRQQEQGSQQQQLNFQGQVFSNFQDNFGIFYGSKNFNT